MRKELILPLRVNRYYCKVYFSLLKDLIVVSPLQVSPIMLNTFPEFTESNLFISLFETLKNS